jgi:signal transduction histidine kinase
MREPEAARVLREGLHEVESQRDDLLVYLSAARAMLDVCASAHGVRATAQGLALALVRELSMEGCAVALRDQAGASLALSGFAAQRDRFGVPTDTLDERGWLGLAELVAPSGTASCFRRDDTGGFTAVPASELASEGFVAVPFVVGDERHGVLVLHTVVAPAERFAFDQGLVLLADMVGCALTVARMRDATERLCDRLSGELGVSRRELTAREQTLRAREDAITRLTKELVRSNNVKAEFLATVSHELRTPLNAILGYGELLQDGHLGALGDEQTEAVTRVLRAARNLHLHVDDVLFFVQMEAERVLVRTEQVSVEQTLAEVVAALPDRPSPDAVRLELAIDPRAATLVTDGSLLRRMLFHLLDNAFKFTPAGTVTVEVRPGDRDDAIVVVRDSGVGIPIERRHAIFEMFVQADGSDARRFDGLGMGLALVYRAAHLLGGTVSVESGADHGSEFTIALPGALGTAIRAPVHATAH